MTTTIFWICLAAAAVAALSWGINNKNNNMKRNGMNDNFTIND